MLTLPTIRMALDEEILQCLSQMADGRLSGETRKAAQAMMYQCVSECLGRGCLGGMILIYVDVEAAEHKSDYENLPTSNLLMQEFKKRFLEKNLVLYISRITVTPCNSYHHRLRSFFLHDVAPNDLVC